MTDEIVVYKPIFNTRKNARTVLKYMREIAQDYAFVSVADFYDIVGYDSKYTDNKYRWVAAQLKGVHILRVEGGWVIDLPRPLPRT